MSGDSGWYVYAVVDAADASTVDPPVGIDRVPAQLVVSDDLAAVAAPVSLAGFRIAQADADLAEDGWLAQAVRAHHRVVEQVFAQAPVLPLRFGAVCASRADVPLVLGSLRARLRAGLTRVAGAAEWSVRLTLAEPAAEPAAEPQTGPDEGTSDGTAWMMRRRATMVARQAVRDRWARTAPAVHESLARHARETCPSGSGARVVYLVARADEERFTATVAALRESELDADMSLEADGPLPPFHFAERSSQHSAERSSQHSAERSSQHSAERSSQHSAERSSQHSAERTSQHSAEGAGGND